MNEIGFDLNTVKGLSKGARNVPFITSGNRFHVVASVSAIGLPIDPTS